MGNKKIYNYNKQKLVPLVQQQMALLSSYEGATCKITKSALCWSGKLKPTPLSKEYQAILTYTLREAPKVWIIGNELEKLDAPDFPHNYKIDVEKKMVQICLYRRQEFNVCKYLSQTIVPWAIEWLYFYELWLVTGEWHGGGEHPAAGEEKIEIAE